MVEDERTKFWAILIGILIAVAVAVTLIDLGIKSAILEESNALKRRIDGVTSGPRPDQTDTDGADHYRHNNGRDAGDDVVPFPTRMEAPTVRKSRARSVGPAPMAGSIEHSERMGNNGVAADDIEVDS